MLGWKEGAGIRRKGMTWVSVSFGKSFLITYSWPFGPNSSLQTSLDCELFEVRDAVLFTSNFSVPNSARCNVGAHQRLGELD